MGDRRETWIEKPQVTGTTTNSYVTAVDAWEVRDESKKTIFVKNTGGSNSMDFKLLSKAYPGGDIEHEEVEASISAGGTYRAALSQWYGALTVQVKSTSSNNHTTYAIEYGARVRG